MSENMSSPAVVMCALRVNINFHNNRKKCPLNCIFKRMPEIAADNILKKKPNKTKKIFHLSCLLAADGFT